MNTRITSCCSEDGDFLLRAGQQVMSRTGFACVSYQGIMDVMRAKLSLSFRRRA